MMLNYLPLVEDRRQDENEETLHLKMPLKIQQTENMNLSRFDFPTAFFSSRRTSETPRPPEQLIGFRVCNFAETQEEIKVGQLKNQKMKCTLLDFLVFFIKNLCTFSQQKVKINTLNIWIEKKGK